jgi:four helix bundle protein
LLKAGTSVGANLEEAQAGQSRADFISKNSIALKEARESNYWLRLILTSYNLEDEIEIEARELRDEAREISLVVAAIIVSARQGL